VKVSRLVYEERLAACEQAMIRLRSAHRVEQEMKAKFGVDDRTARKWMRAIKKKWKEEAEAEGYDRTTMRVEMDRTLNEVLAAAMNRTIIVKDKDGNPMLDQNPNSPTYGKPLVKANPDLQRVLHACIQLRALHSLDQPTRAHVTVAPDITASLDIEKLIKDKPDAQEHLKKLLESVSPDGTLGALAGEWFRTDSPDKKD
jgi:hypothetical protein